MTSVAIRLPFPPSLNNLFANGRKGRYPTKRYVAWQKVALAEIMVQRPKRFSVPVKIELLLTPPDRRARDADNFCKAVIDSLVKMRVIPDDSNRWVRAVSPTWGTPNRAGAGVSVTITTDRE